MPPSPTTPTATNSGQALQNLQTYQQGIQDPSQILNQQDQQLGIPQAQQAVSGLRSAISNTTNLLNNVAPGVMGRTQNSLVTAGQANKLISNEQAPISANLNQQNSSLNTQNADLTSLLGQAQSQTNAELQGQSQQEQYLQNIYNDMFGSEQAQASAQAQQAQQAEAEREFNAQLAAQQASTGASNALSAQEAALLSGKNGGASLPAGMSMKNPSSGAAGYNFNLGGKAVSAGTFAAQNNIPIGTLLQQMGKSGDTSAQNAYNWLKTVTAEGLTPAQIQATPAWKQTFSSLFWGT